MSGPILVLYDISDDARRERIRRRLKELADRIQQSGWLVPAGADVQPEHLIATLAAAAGPADRIRAYAPCPACARDARWLPAQQPFTLARLDGWVVTRAVFLPVTRLHRSAPAIPACTGLGCSS